MPQVLCCLTLLLAMTSLLVRSSPVPMKSVSNTSPEAIEHSWWLNVLDLANDESSSHHAEPVLAQSHSYDGPLGHTRYEGSLGHTSFADPAFNLLQTDHLPWDEAEHVAWPHWAEGRSSQSPIASHEQDTLNTLEPAFPLQLQWQHGAFHPQVADAHHYGLPFGEGTSYIHPDAFQMHANYAPALPVPQAIPHAAINSYLAPPNAAAAASTTPHAIDLYPDQASSTVNLDSPHLSTPGDVFHTPFHPVDRPGDLQSGEQSSDGVETPINKAKKQDGRGRVAASRFLEHHPQFKMQTKVPPTVSEMSPDALQLKASINEHLFKNKLDWKKKGDDMIASSKMEYNQFRQFVRRIDSRNAWFTAEPRASWLPKGLVAVPHKSYALGNVMFDPEPKAKSLLFSFWTPSSDERQSRLQFVGSASLGTNDGTEVLRQVNAPEHNRSLDELDFSKTVTENRVVAQPRTQPPVPVAGGQTATKAWLRRLPLVKQILPESSDDRQRVTDNLISEMHHSAEQIKRVANKVMFDGNVVWQRTPEETMLNKDSESAAGIFRYHKRSEILYLAKAETLSLLPYRLLLIPYEIQGIRAKLFDASLGGHFLTFTVWAAHDLPGGEYADKYTFVSGASVSILNANNVLQKAKETLQQLTEAHLPHM